MLVGKEESVEVAFPSRETHMSFVHISHITLGKGRKQHAGGNGNQ